MHLKMKNTAFIFFNILVLSVEHPYNESTTFQFYFYNNYIFNQLFFVTYYVTTNQVSQRTGRGQ